MKNAKREGKFPSHPGYLIPAMDTLERIFRNEHFYPDLLPFEEEVFDSFSDKLFYLKRSLQEAELNCQLDGSALLISIYKTDIQRINFLLVNYLTIRREKIQKYYFYIQQNITKYSERMHSSELSFLSSYYQMSNKLIIRTGEFEEFVAKNQKLFEFPVEPLNAGAFFLMTGSHQEGQLSIVKTIDIEQIAQIIQSEARLL